MRNIKKISIILIFIINIIILFQINNIFAKTSYIEDEELTYRTLEDGETLISGFKIGEKVSEVKEKFSSDYIIKIKNNQGIEITNQLDTKIGTGNKIELYEEGILVKTYTVVIYGDTNGDSSIGAVDSLGVVKNKIGKEEFTKEAQEEAGRVLNSTRKSGVVPKADDALYIVKYKLHPETYPIDQKMLQTDEEVPEYTLTIKHYLENANDINYTLNTTTTQTLEYGTEITLADHETNITNGTYKQGSLTENGTAVTTTTLKGDTTIYLYYSRNTYTLTLAKNDYVSTVTGEGIYKIGQNVTIGATLKTETGYSINWSGWTSDNANLLANNPTQNTTIAMPAGNVTLTANATRIVNKYTLTVKHYLENANDTNYSLITTTTSQNIAYGTQINLKDYTIVITYGTYKQGSLTESGVASTKTTMGINTTIYLYYSRNTYTVTVQAGSNISSVSGSGTVKIGASKSISATVSSGYTFNSWNIISGSGTISNSKSASTKITPTSNIILQATALQAIAQVGTTQYASIQEAINSISSNVTQTTVQVLVAHTLTANITNSKNVILDLGGKTVKTNSYYIDNNGTLQITNGTIDSNARYCLYNSKTLIVQSGAILKNSNGDVIENTSNGDVTINGATLQSTSTSSFYDVIFNKGTFTMNSGTITASESNGMSLQNGEGATAYIYGGTIDSRNVESNTISNFGTIIIGKSGKTLYIYGSIYPTLVNHRGTMTIENGNIYGYSSNTIIHESGTLNINGGIINSTNNSHPTIRIEGGTMLMTAGTITNSGGGYTIYNNGGTARKTGGTAIKNYGVTN